MHRICIVNLIKYREKNNSHYWCIVGSNLNSYQCTRCIQPLWLKVCKQVYLIRMLKNKTQTNCSKSTKLKIVFKKIKLKKRRKMEWFLEKSEKCEIV